jgi:hypothetical protein
MRAWTYGLSLVAVALVMSVAMAAENAPAAASAPAASKSMQCGNQNRHQHGAMEKGAPAMKSADCAAAPASAAKQMHDHQKMHKQG